MSRRHILLVGLPGAGKSTVGSLVAGLLGAPFMDFDQVIEERAGKSVERIFAEDGEARFRLLEGTVGAEGLSGNPSVLAPGGGYLLDDARRRMALDQSYAVYLRVSAKEAARRLESAPVRPLIKGFEPWLRLKQLLDVREGAYLQAQGRVDTNGLAPEKVADQVVALARTYGGW